MVHRPAVPGKTPQCLPASQGRSDLTESVLLRGSAETEAGDWLDPVRILAGVSLGLHGQILQGISRGWCYLLSFSQYPKDALHGQILQGSPEAGRRDFAERVLPHGAAETEAGDWLDLVRILAGVSLGPPGQILQGVSRGWG